MAFQVIADAAERDIEEGDRREDEVSTDVLHF